MTTKEKIKEIRHCAEEVLHIDLSDEHLGEIAKRSKIKDSPQYEDYYDILSLEVKAYIQEFVNDKQPTR